jgi:predicted GIY-YIG superfamily endonuclease
MEADRRQIVVHVETVLKHIPAPALGMIPNHYGAYVIHDMSGRRYVGSSNTLRSRVQAHQSPLDPNVQEPIRTVCCYAAREHMDARILEYWLIREIAPELNKSFPEGAGCLGDRCQERCESIGATGREIAIDVEVVRVVKDLRADELASVPSAPGVYVLRTHSGGCYVGMSNSLRDRVRSHIDNPADPNIHEPLQSICVYETRSEADAHILEYALIRDLCPDLNRENQPDASEWKPGSRKAILATANPKLGDLQAELSRRILGQVGGKEVIRKSWITYQISPMKNFCAVKVLADSLQVDLKVDQTFSDPAGVTERLERTQVWTFDRRLRVRTLPDLEAAMPFIWQAFRAMGGSTNL